MNPEKMQNIIEAALMIAGHPLTVSAIQNLFSDEEKPSTSEVKTHLQNIRSKFEDSGIILQEVASGFRFQAKTELSPWLAKLWEERPPRYTRAFLETLAIIAYKQPVTRAEIEDIRGVTVSSNIMKTLQERDWVHILGYREVPGKPALYGTTKNFLNYFNLKSLSNLPPLSEFKNLAAQDAELQVQLALEGKEKVSTENPGIKILQDGTEEESENVKELETKKEVEDEEQLTNIAAEA